MANPEFFKPEFDKHAINGVIGDPNGKPAYAYLRVSSKGQAEEGRAGLPRQIEMVHEKAKELGYKISWNMIFADDHTGFEFDDRPQLGLMLKEMQNKQNRRADILIIEMLQRLSRNVDWHQGYLLDVLSKMGISVYSYIPIGSRIERHVHGVIDQDGMLESIRKMKDGTKRKLESGRITAKTAAYGYRLVDSSGGLTKVRRDTHYQIYEPEAQVIRIIFEMIASGNSLKKVCEALEGIYPPVKRAKCWEMIQVSNMIKSRLYKGEYIGNRYLFEKETINDIRGTKKRMKRTVKPENEWIIIPIPPIVDESLWQAANDMLKKNATMAARNGKGTFLLTGLVKCATCGLTYTGCSKEGITYYRCSSYSRPKPIKDALNCHQVMIRTDLLEGMIWDVIFNLISNPESITKFFEDKNNEDETIQIKSQIKFLKSQMESYDIADRKIKDGYNVGVYTAEEAKEERELIKQKREKTFISLEELSGNLLTFEQLQAQKEMLIRKMDQLKQQKLSRKIIPNEIKIELFKTIVDKVVVDTTKRTIEVFGIIKTSWEYDDSDYIEYTSVRRDIFNYYSGWFNPSNLGNSYKMSLFIVVSNTKVSMGSPTFSIM